MIILLIEKICSMILILLAGFLLVRLKLAGSRDCKILSVISVYLILPCVILRAFMVDITPELKDGLLLSLIAAIVLEALMVLLTIPAKKIFKLDRIEQASVIYSNAGNLIIPLVAAVLGDEYVIYCSTLIAVQLCMIWSHGKMLVCGEKGFQLKKILLQPNIICCILGVIILVTGFRFPAPVNDAMDSVSAMLAPAAMLIIGMLMGGMQIKKIAVKRKIWIVAALRLLILPLFTLPLLKLTGADKLLPDAGNILLVSFFGVITPVASTVTQQAQVYGTSQEADYASAINILTMLLCLITMPLMVYLYQLF